MTDSRSGACRHQERPAARHRIQEIISVQDRSTVALLYISLRGALSTLQQSRLQHLELLSRRLPPSAPGPWEGPRGTSCVSSTATAMSPDCSHWTTVLSPSHRYRARYPDLGLDRTQPSQRMGSRGPASASATLDDVIRINLLHVVFIVTFIHCAAR